MGSPSRAGEGEVDTDVEAYDARFRVWQLTGSIGRFGSRFLERRVVGCGVFRAYKDGS